MEIWDVYDQYRRKTGRTHQRGVPLPKGDYHLVVHIWIINQKGQYLIQKRQPWKEGWPGAWDCSAAGSATQGDDSIQAALRETQEEIGLILEPKMLEKLFSINFRSGFDDVYLVRQDLEETKLKLQYEEVAEVRWAYPHEIREMVKMGEFIPYPCMDRVFSMAESPVSLTMATLDDAETLYAMQREVFKPLYEKYQDHDTSPVTQPKDRFLRRFEIGDYYKINYQSNLAGSVFVFEKEPGTMKLHIINILENYQNKGIAQQVMERLEKMYPHITKWELETIETEQRNCHVYEKMGYKQTSKRQQITEKLTIITYLKDKDLKRISPM